jgi:DNA-binding response OmpR family regulator
MGDSISLNGMRVLVVEDSWPVANAIKRLAENAGMVVVGPAATVDEADQLLLTLTPDVAIVDINLRGEMAYGLINRLRMKDVPTIATSGYDAFSFGKDEVTAVLTKPFRAGSLLAHLRRITAARLAG